MSEVTGRITRISGPIVYAEGLESCGLYDVVDVGEKKLIGEIIRQKKGIATVQVYEDDTGMRIGEPVVCNKRPLSVRLGPGLVGTIYDGIQRPLASMFNDAGAFLEPGQRTEPLETKRKWKFTPLKKEGDAIAPGMVIGSVPETSSIMHKIMVPPAIKGRVLASVEPEGEYTVDDAIAETELDATDPLAGEAVTVLSFATDTYSDWSGWKYAYLLNPHTEGEVWTVDPRWIEQSMILDINKKAMKHFRRNPFTADVLVSWFMIKQYELDCIRTAAEGLRLSVDESHMKEFAGIER